MMSSTATCQHSTHSQNHFCDQNDNTSKSFSRLPCFLKPDMWCCVVGTPTYGPLPVSEHAFPFKGQQAQSHAAVACAVTTSFIQQHEAELHCCHQHDDSAQVGRSKQLYRPSQIDSPRQEEPPIQLRCENGWMMPGFSSPTKQLTSRDAEHPILDIILGKII